MLTPKPTQLDGAVFLANRRRAMLADLPRCGKTGSAVIASDYILANDILVITTSSGCGVLRRGFEEWSPFGRKIQVLTGGGKLRDDTQVCVVSWGMIIQPAIRAQILKRRWQAIIPDEAHAAKNFETKRTQALYGTLLNDGADLATTSALVKPDTEVVWPLTGTPIPNCPLDVYPMLRALAPERLAADPAREWPDVTALSAFTERYCKMRPMKVGRSAWGKRINVFVEGRNLGELRARMEGFFLQRTQKDVGILEPEYEIMPLDVRGANEAIAALSIDARQVLKAAEDGDTKSLEMHLGPLRRLTGEIKAHAIVEAVVEEFDAGLNKIVLAYWHKDVGDILQAGLAKFSPARLDGATPKAVRTNMEQAFLRNPKCRVFLGQIQAAGEAIDLSAAQNLIFAETSPVPKDMLQMSLRVTNHSQQQRPLVRVATLDGSIDDALQRILMRKWAAIREVL